MKGRWKRGQDHPKARLTNDDVDLMRELYDEGVSIPECARKFDTSYYTAYDILKCKTRAS